MSGDMFDPNNSAVANSPNGTKDKVKTGAIQSFFQLKIFKLKSAMYEVFNNMKVLYSKDEIDAEGDQNKVRETVIQSVQPDNSWSKYIPPPELDVLFQNFPH